MIIVFVCIKLVFFRVNIYRYITSEAAYSSLFLFCTINSRFTSDVS